jgi:selenide,water dikinase
VGPLDDAALLRPESGSRLAFTVDFITPIVDDPETFGAIAAANALSDVYAMGGDPQVALSICGFPDGVLPREVLTRILQGGREKAAEAGCAIVGGHTVLDPELKYGLCVLGSVPDGRSLSHTGGRAGDRLLLTKPLGLGVAAQAIKKQQLPADDLERVVDAMTTLNRSARDAALASGSRAATDVTGYGLLGHLHHLALGSGLSARVEARAVPRFDFARGLVEAGLVPGGSAANLEYVAPWTRFATDVDRVERLLLADAQTSGGLLFAVPPGSAERALADLEERATPACAVVGELLEGPAGEIEVV